MDSINKEHFEFKFNRPDYLFDLDIKNTSVVNVSLADYQTRKDYSYYSSSIRQLDKVSIMGEEGDNQNLVIRSYSEEVTPDRTDMGK